MHEVLVNRLGGLSLPRKSVVRLTDRPDMTLDVYRGRKTTMQQQQQQVERVQVFLFFFAFLIIIIHRSLSTFNAFGVVWTSYLCLSLVKITDVSFYYYHLHGKIWTRLFKTNDVVS